ATPVSTDKSSTSPKRCELFSTISASGCTMIDGTMAKTDIGSSERSKVGCIAWPSPFAVSEFESCRLGGRTSERSGSMSTVRVKVDLSRPTTLPKGRVDRRKLDATTEADLAIQQAEDDAEAMQDAARFVRCVRRRLGLTQQEFARRIDVPLDT